MSGTQVVWPIRVRAPSLDSDVVVYESTWVDHICTGHPEMAPFLDQVVATVVAPDIVTEHQRHPARTYFYRDWSDVAEFPTKWLCVMVLFLPDEQEGRLLSAWPTTAIRGGRLICINRLELT